MLCLVILGMKFIAAFLVAIALVCVHTISATAAPPTVTDEQLELLFTRFVSAHSKTYPSAQVLSRFNTFKANFARIVAHNSRVPRPTYTLGINSFADLSPAEFAQMYRLDQPLARPRFRKDNTNAAAKSASQSLSSSFSNIPGFDLSESDIVALAKMNSNVNADSSERKSTRLMPKGVGATISTTNTLPSYLTDAAAAASDLKDDPPGAIKDWRLVGALNPVRDMSTCSASYAFATMASLEAATYITKGQLPSLSTQQVVDCSEIYGNAGCSGGFIDSTFEYAIANGICDEATYPYKATRGDCYESKCSPPAGVMAEYIAPANATDEALMAIVYNGVVAVGMHLPADMQFYTGGVFNGPCDSEPNAALAVIGYDITEAAAADLGRYFTLRQSWGKAWGEEGHMRLAYGDGLCGINSMAAYAKLPRE